MSEDASPFADIAKTALPGKQQIIKADDLVFQQLSEYEVYYFSTSFFYISGKKFRVDNYSGDFLHKLSSELITDIATCYADIFNKTWGERWTIKSATDEIVKSFEYSKNRFASASFLFIEDKVVGFCWSTFLSKDSVSLDREMPFCLSRKHKQNSYVVTCYWLNQLIKKEKLIFVREMAVLKEYRKVLTTPILLEFTLKVASNLGYRGLLYWTNIYSKAFKWGIGVGWKPLHFFIRKDIVLMSGNVTCTLDKLHRFLDKDQNKAVLKSIKDNIDAFYCKS